MSRMQCTTFTVLTGLAIGWSAAIVSAAPLSPAALTEARNRMVDSEIAGAGVRNPRVLEAMRNTPRHEFVSLAQRDMAYYDMALPIGEGQTISPPFIVAYMTEQLDPQPSDKVLEIGTGSGYQAAVLSPLVKDVYTIEIKEPLGLAAARVLKRLKYTNVHPRIGDGYQGWPDVAPFDKIIVTCSPENIPEKLVEQLREGGRMIVPLGERYQQTLYLFRKENGKMVSEALRPTLFVPMTGEAESLRKVKPDPLHPTLVNGSFEEMAKDGDLDVPKGWHYVRQAAVVDDSRAPEGKRYVRFTNITPGRGSQMLQAFPLDGSKIPALDVSLMVKGEALRPGNTPGEAAYVVVTFYDENQRTLAERGIGPFRDTFDWRREHAVIRVPPRTAHAILRLGLLGGVGELDVDNVAIAPTR
ncbi:MAG TPA: protein-L-isoaspartate(D-aspartate) O-methyltransferase [Pirellulales bacterium]|nr:protein-L-isoaspartate(D-aspartate) O-methyltransferase [Pirellulales bacterium]